MWLRFVGGVLLAAALCGRVEAQAAPTDGGWETVAGKWEIANGEWLQLQGDGGYCYALAKGDSASRGIEFEATPLERNRYNFCSFGVVLKYAGKTDFMAIHLGSYGSMSYIYSEGGARKIAGLGRLAFLPGETHSLKVQSARGKIAVFLDGRLRMVLRDMMPERPWRLGLFTECRCRFRNVVLKNQEEDSR